VGLTTLWSSNDEYPVFSVDSGGEYSSFSAYSFGENLPLWVVSDSRNELDGADDYRDVWSNVVNLPRFRPSDRPAVWTSVMHPLRRGGKPIGMLEFASKAYIEPTPASQDEVTTLAETISRAYRMYDVRETQRQNTNHALELLESSLTTESWTRLALPKIFVAYPGGGSLDGEVLAEHKRVIGEIRKVVNDFDHLLTAVFWEDINQSGSINDQVIAEITSSEFGLCYFSEPSDGSYADNDNVLFEAGMMQALTNSPGALLRAWLPIRERDSVALPFDVAGERMLKVHRDEGGRLDVAAFADALRGRLLALLEELRVGEV
jgi:hypothetical protein